MVKIQFGVMKLFIRTLFSLSVLLLQTNGQPSEQAEEDTDFGLAGPDPDCRIFLTHGVTTMFWLKSHHLLFAS